METEILRHIPADIHNHSTLSPDGCDEPMRMAERACGLGIKHFALTDHIECEKLESWDYAGAIARSHDVFLEIQERFRGKMEVYYGAELGQALFNLPAAEKILAEHDYDFVLGSTHCTRTYPRLDRVPDSDEDRYRCLDEYFDEELRLAEWGRFCSLSHLTFPLRFISGDVGGHEVDMSRCSAIIDKILEIIIRQGIALEVNSAGIRKGLHVPMPNAEYVKRYYDKGGRMVTVGSDAYRVADVAADVPQVYGMLRDIGFTEVCVFRKKQPIFVSIN